MRELTGGELVDVAGGNCNPGKGSSKKGASSKKGSESSKKGSSKKGSDCGSPSYRYRYEGCDY